MSTSIPPKKDFHFLDYIDDLKEKNIISKAIHSVFKDKINRLFDVRGEGNLQTFNYFPNTHQKKKIKYHENFSIHEHFDAFFYANPEARISKPIPHLTLTFTGEMKNENQALVIALSSNYISELPAHYYINGTCVAVIDVKNISTMRVLIKRLVGKDLMFYK